ncbi:MAG: PIN domain-containing protein [Clostridia bacterium]|nr:PIN domain-containing protein [Clostridia bacterium]
MGRLNQVLAGHEVVAIDTNCFIYYLEGGLWAEELKEDVFLPLEQGRFRAVTSVLTVAEILVRPKSLGLEDVCEEYTLLLSSYPNLEITPFTLQTALRCAEVRARHRIRTPDALQIATALEKGAGVFLTNDAGLPPEVDGLQVVVLRDFLGSPSEN